MRRTADGGTAWSPVALPSPLGQLSNVACQANGHCVVLGYSSVNSAPLSATSTDSGATWSLAPPLPVFEDPSFGDIPVSMFDITCPDSDVCYAMGGLRDPVAHLPNFAVVVLKSTNGGSSWATLDSFPTHPSSVAPSTPVQWTGYAPGLIVCSSATNCLASTKPHFLASPDLAWRTADGGASWQAVEFPTTPDS